MSVLIEKKALRIPQEDFKNWVNQSLEEGGVDPNESAIIAENVVWNELVGRRNYGIDRLPNLIERLNIGAIQSPCKAQFSQTSEVIYHLDGGNGFGQYVSYLAMEKALHIAAKFGVGIVAVHRSHHFGTGAYFVNLAAQKFNIGIACTNASKKVAPFGGTTACLGTNPLAFGAPGENGQSILIDFSTSSSAGSTIRKAIENNIEIPQGILINASGKPITDPKLASEGTILPFGGAKGFGLGLMVEILSAVITGSDLSFQIPTQFEETASRTQNIGHFFLALDLTNFFSQKDYCKKLEALRFAIKKSRKQEGIREILLPGETRWKNYQEQCSKGINIDDALYSSIENLAKQCKVAFPWRKCHG